MDGLGLKQIVVVTKVRGYRRWSRPKGKGSFNAKCGNTERCIIGWGVKVGITAKACDDEGIGIGDTAPGFDYCWDPGIHFVSSPDYRKGKR